MKLSLFLVLLFSFSAFSQDSHVTSLETKRMQIVDRKAEIYHNLQLAEQNMQQLEMRSQQELQQLDLQLQQVEQLLQQVRK